MGQGTDQATVRVEPRPSCLLCGKKGLPLYKDLTDRLFSAPGAWSLSQCPDHDCGLIWLDPMPVKEDLGKLYADYYTHEEQPALASKKNFFDHFFVFLHFLILGRRLKKYVCMYLDKEKPGRLLEVGCGNGDRLRHMRSLGWDAIGIEIDPAAQRLAEKKSGCKVYSEDLETIQFQDHSFDAVIMSHVIEHVDDPVGLLKECLRILKPGGKFVATTPNALSLGHRFFKSDWRGLEPPRHLYIFSTSSIQKMLALLGVQAFVFAESSNVGGIVQGSLKIKHGTPDTVPWYDIRVISFILFEWFVHMFDNKTGEECVVVAIKSKNGDVGKCGR